MPETNKIFENQLNREILESESLRVKILAIVAAIPVVFLTLLSLILKDRILEVMDSLDPLYLIILVLLVFCLREFNISLIIKKLLNENRQLNKKIRYINTLLEISFPTLILFILSFYWDSVLVLATPGVILYILIVLSTTLSLDYKLSLFAGASAAAEFIILVFYLQSISPEITAPTILDHPEIHVAKGILIFVSGGIAAFISKRLLESINNSYFALSERNRIASLFGQQISAEIVDELLAYESEIESKRKFVCIMFLDIRDFTPFAEKLEPEEIIEYQNSVFGFMIEIITKYKGIINQFLGDGYMATFGAPISREDDCGNAIRAALEIADMVNLKSKGGEIMETRIGIGLHAGYVVTGNVGTSIRKQYSISGNTVILASRIEQLNKKFNTQVLVSEEVIENSMVSEIKAESLGEIQIKGREQPVNIYKLA
jgi:adenylate cyclase